MSLRQWWKKKRKSNSKAVSTKHQQYEIPREQHGLSRNMVSDNALKVLYRLKKAGYQAYLVGGAVRDLLLGITPKDFDVATDATPEQVYKLFRNSRIIGRRFKIAHVFFGRDIIEVSTFRSDAPETSSIADGPVRNNDYGNLEQDVWRRDFTVNALYYNIANFAVVDYAGGMKDLQQRCLRVVGDPESRFAEDPVRALRAIRLSAKLDLDLDPSIHAVLPVTRPLLKEVAPARLFHEVLKCFFAGYAEPVFAALQDYDYLSVMFPLTADSLLADADGMKQELINLALINSDARFNRGQSLNPGFLFSVLLWPVLQDRLHGEQKGRRFFQALHQGMEDILRAQVKALAIPRRLQVMMEQIWLMQYHLEHRRKRRLLRVVNQRYYRAAFDFLLLRSELDNSLQPIVAWWREFYEAGHEQRLDMIDAL